jgi:hypothetical protein
MVGAKGELAVAPRQPCGLASRGALRPQTGRPWGAAPKDKAAGGVNRRAPLSFFSHRPKSFGVGSGSGS